MKKLISFAFVAIIMSTLFVTTSCKKDKDEDLIYYVTVTTKLHDPYNELTSTERYAISAIVDKSTTLEAPSSESLEIKIKDYFKTMDEYLDAVIAKYPNIMNAKRAYIKFTAEGSKVLIINLYFDGHYEEVK